MNTYTNKDKEFLDEAILEAKLSKLNFGVPIGAVLVLDDKIQGRGHDQKIQKSSPTLHGILDCIQNAGKLKPSEYKRAVLYSTVSPCELCTGAILLCGIKKIFIGENEYYRKNEDYLKANGVEIIVMNSKECKELITTFKEENPELWDEHCLIDKEKIHENNN